MYFVGDSITRRWGALDYPGLLANWKANFYGWNAANLGWGADRIQHILWRLENGELDRVRPKIIVVLAGTNNVGSQPGEKTIADITRGLKSLVDLCQRKVPDATLLLTAIFLATTTSPSSLKSSASTRTLRRSPTGTRSGSST